MINQYFSNFGNVINSLDIVINSEIQTRRINDFLGIIEGKLTFEIGNGFILRSSKNITSTLLSFINI